MTREPLTKKELEEIKKILVEMKKKITGEIRRLTEDNISKSQKEASGEISSYTYHMADMASASFDRDFAFSLASNEQELLYMIDEALSKIESGEYGICESCGVRIPKRRLKAIPYARYCVKCQEEEEKRIKRERK
ncbi:MAG: TraR/DksA family transcriptional regulator [Candidatus Omnitrophota bacterium]|nr:MAG: TraR/DksA family transcriptional regulator [Candidatus Omnitrophota bacterium]HDM08594.1 TraR/DksA family transcriptional regulator [Candidatus Omnitrophota bacterium]